jgi:hypothetical protein
MYTALCHSGMLLGSIATLAFVAAAVGGLGLWVASALRRATTKA